MHSWEIQALLNKLPEPVRGLAKQGSIQSFRKNWLIVQEGKVEDSLYILLSGSVRAFSVDDGDAERELTLSIDRAGDYFGEMSLDGGPRSASVITLEPTVCAVVTCQMVMDHVVADAAFAKDLIAHIIGRARIATVRARRLALLSVYQRLAALLDDLARAAGGRELPRITHQDIANRVGASREMISRLMKDLERGGFIAVDERVIRLLRPLPEDW